MLDKTLSLIAPHHCCGCNKTGSLLCDNCNNYIIDERDMFCIVCGRPTFNMSLCNDCTAPYQKAWVVGARKGVLQRVIGLYKFERAMAGYKVLGDLMLNILPDLPDNTVIVPIPTVSGHIRERGYDHILLIAKYIANKRKLKLEQILSRKTGTKQRQSSARQRQSQAREAFCINGVVDPDKIYLLIDDVVTTGATIKYASLLLTKAGAKQVWVAAVARQVKE